MREVLKIDLSGFIVDVELANDNTSGIMPIYETPETLEDDTQPEEVLVGYMVYERCKEGLHKPKFDLSAWDAYQSAIVAAQESYAMAYTEWSSQLEESRGDAPVYAVPEKPEFWVEGLTQAEIDAIKNTPQPETPEQKISSLETENALLAHELMNTKIALEQTQQEQATLLLALVEAEVI